MRSNLQLKIVLFVAMIIILIMFIVVAKADGHLNNNMINDASPPKVEVNENDKESSKTAAKEENETQAKDEKKDDSLKESSVNKEIFFSDEELNELYKIYDDSLFIGDSRTEGIKIYSGVTNADFFCKKSMDIEKILAGEKVSIAGKEQSLSEVINNKTYSKIYLCLGINELGWDTEDFIAKYQQLVDTIKKTQTSSKIYVQLIFPVNEERIKEKNSAKEYVNNSKIKSVNGKLISLAKANKVIHLNPAKPLVDANGNLKGDATIDGIHVNREYCKQLAGYLAKITK